MDGSALKVGGTQRHRDRSRPGDAENAVTSLYKLHAVGFIRLGVLRSAIVPVPTGNNTYYDRPHIYVYNARSGALVRSMTGSRDVHWAVLWSSPDGQSFVVSAVSEGTKIPFIRAARFAGGRWHRVPLPPRALAVAW